MFSAYVFCLVADFTTCLVRCKINYSLAPCSIISNIKTGREQPGKAEHISGDSVYI